MARYLRFSWPKDHPDEVSFRVARLAKDMDDFSPVLAQAAGILQQDLEERFETGTDPHGRAWKDWSPDYRKTAERKNREVFGDRASLQMEGEMYDSMQSPDQWTITQNEIFLDTSGFDEKWAWHNYGLKNRTKKGGALNPLPKREFLGTSEAADQLIISRFGAWLEGLVTAATGPKGSPFFRHAQRGGNPANTGQFSRRTY